MAFVEKAYMSERASLSTAGTSVTEAVESFFVRFTTQDVAETGGAGMMFRAVSAFGLPTVWSPHPNIPNLNLVSFRPTPAGNTAAYVDCVYVNVQPQRIIRGGCGLISERTDIDIDGNPIVLSNKGCVKPGTGGTQTVSDAEKIVIGGHIDVFRAEGTVLIERVRPSLLFPSGIDPAAQSADFTGTVNSTTVFGVGPRKAMCESVSFNNDGLAGVAWRMQYEFRINRRGFDRRVVFINAETGNPEYSAVKAPGFDAGSPGFTTDVNYGRKVIRCYEERDFNILVS